MHRLKRLYASKAQRVIFKANSLQKGRYCQALLSLVSCCTTILGYQKKISSKKELLLFQQALFQAPKSELSKRDIFLKPYLLRTWNLFFSNYAPYFSKQALNKAKVTLPYHIVCNMVQSLYNCTVLHNLIEHCQS